VARLASAVKSAGKRGRWARLGQRCHCHGLSTALLGRGFGISPLLLGLYGRWARICLCGPGGERRPGIRCVSVLGATLTLPGIAGNYPNHWYGGRRHIS